MPETIGQRLKQAREDRNLSIEKIEQLTRIRAHYIQALESDDYSIMPSAAQARGFLRNYAEYLGLNIDEILLELQRAQTLPPETEGLSGPLSSVDNSSLLPASPLEEKPAGSSLGSFLNRFRKSESTLETESPETTPAEQPVSETLAAILEVEPVISPEVQPEESVVAESETPKTRGRKKKAAVPESRPKTGPKRKKTNQASQEPLAETSAPVVVEEPVVVQVDEPKMEAEPPSVTNEEQVETQNEPETEDPKPGLLARVAALFHVRVTKPDLEKEGEEVSPVVIEPVRPKPELPPQNPEEIFKEVGAELRKRRDMLSLNIDEVERHTRMRSSYIRAMEEGKFDDLPSPVQTRGMLANYATFLDLDADALLLRFADALQARHRLKFPEKPTGSKPPMEVVPSLPPLRSFIAGDLLFGIFIVAVLFGLAIWGVRRIIAIQTAEQALALATAPSISEVLAGLTQSPEPDALTLLPPLTPQLAETQPVPEVVELPTLGENVNVQISIVAVERAFMRVTADGEVEFDGRVLPGTVYTYEAGSQIEVLTGNGSALRVTYNGRDLGLMGGFGEVVDRVYTGSGIATPTATLPPTPTNTPLPSPTLTGSETPTFTATPTITVTP